MDGWRPLTIYLPHARHGSKASFLRSHREQTMPSSTLITCLNAQVTEAREFRDVQVNSRECKVDMYR